MHSAFDLLTTHFVSFYSCIKVFVMVRLDTCMPFPYSIRDSCSGEVFVLMYVFCTVGLPSLLFCE